MDSRTSHPSPEAQLLAENADLRARLEEAEETLRAIRMGDVDSLIVETDEGPQIFSLNTAEAVSNRLRGEILAQVSDAVRMIDNDERITYLNPACERMYRVQAGEMLGRKLGELYQRRWLKPGDEADAIAALREKGEAVSELIHVTRDGRELQVQSSVCQMRDATGKVTGIIAAIRDITERKQAEDALRLAEENLRDFVNHATVGLHWVGPDGIILWANRAELELLGYSAAEYIGHHIAEFHAEQSVIEDILRRLAQRETLHEYEARLRCKDGSIREVLINSNVLWDGDKFIHTRCITRDVTAQKKAEEARALLATIIESSEDAILSKDLNGTIATWNRGAERLFGYTAQEAIGQPITTLFPPDKLDEEQQIMARVRDGQRVLPYETVRRRKDGGLLNVSLTVSPIMDSRGQIVGASKIARDITDRKQAEDALRKSQQFTRSVLDNLFAFVGVLRVDGTLIETNRAPLEAAGISAGEVLGKKFWECFWWSYSPQLQAQLRAWCSQVAAGEIIRADVQVRLAGDARVWIDFQLTPLRDAEGRVTHLISSGMDISARRQAEAALRASEEFSSTVLESSPDCVNVLDGSGRLQFMNANGARLLEIDDLANFHGQPWWKLWPDESEATVRDAVERAGRGESVHFQMFGPTWKGSPKWWDVVVAPVPGKGGEDRAQTLISVSRDMTAQRAAEQELRESEARLALGMEVVELGLAEVDYTTGLTHLAASAARLFGLGDAAVTLPRAAVKATFHPEDREEVERRVAQCRDPAGRGWFEMEHRVVWPSGEVRWLSVRQQVFFTGEGAARRPARAILVALDVTDAKAASEALRVSDERFRAAIDAVSDIVWTNNSQGEMEGEQAIWGSFTGQRRHEYQGYGWSKAVHPDDAQPTIDAWQLAVAEKRTFEFEHRVRRHDGEWRLCSIRAVPLLNVRQEVREWVGVHTDITDRKRAEEQLRRQAAELSDADRRKDEFLATLAHELRNPLAPVSNSIELMKRAKGDSALQERARATIERQVAQMVRLIDDLLDVSRITRDKLTLKPERIDLKSIVNHAVEICRPHCEREHQDFRVVLPTASIPLHADAARLAQVLGNLLNNASKFTPAGGRIDLIAELLGGEVVVTVRDNGIGIAPEMQLGVFDLFTQVDASRSLSKGGLGIGLALAKRLTEMHGGTIAVHSDGPGRGSEFVLRLPVILDDRYPEQTQALAGAMAPVSARRILVVDDNADIATSMVDLLALDGHETLMAQDGLEAVAKAASFRPHVILLDIGLPNLNGYEACRRIREQAWTQDLLIIAMTGWGQAGDRRKSADAGFDNHCVKPVDHAVLMNLLNQPRVRPD